MMQKCHFIGIGGIGMSGLARILLKQNVSVSGSDLSESYVTESLIKEGAQVRIGHSATHITPEMTVVYSTDIKKDNPEFQQAVQLNCPLLHRSDLLLKLMDGYKTLAITGTHGKTTTTGLLTSILMEAREDPSFAVGGFLPRLKINSGHGQGKYFVAEVDESDGSFLKCHPWGAIITNIDTDHMDYFKTEANLKASFDQFFQQVSSLDHLFWCGDNKSLRTLNPKGISYGFDKKCSLHLTRFRQEGWRGFFDFSFKGKNYANIELPLLGQHNALNAAAVFGMALQLGITEETIRTALKTFHGISRRCEIKSEFNGVLLIDDYAHHPTEIQATLKGVRQAVKEKRLFVVFQPHRYTRTQACLGTYGTLFDEADEVIVTDIFGAGEPPIPNLSPKQIVEEIHAQSTIPCQYIPRAELSHALYEKLRPHDVVIGLGAGDITQLSHEIQACQKMKKMRKWKVGVIYGGKSLEHEISLLSARHIIDSLNPDYYDVIYFGITKQGEWLSGSDVYERLQNPTQTVSSKEKQAILSSSVLESLVACDLLFPVLHGPNGEDGTIQGLFETLGKAYVGCDYRSSAICMDKALTKKLMVLNGIPTPAFVDFSHYDWKRYPDMLVDQIHKQLQYPLFVKPVHLGSSVGVYKVENEETLRLRINQAFLIDDHIVIENGLKVRELEFSVLGNDEVTVFPPGEIYANGEVYDYAAKYDKNCKPTTPKASLSQEQTQEGLYLAEMAYKAIGCCGMARVDCFLDEAGKIWLNEINPIPGFTQNSLYPKMCEVNGLNSSDLMDRLIVMGFQRRRQQNRHYLTIVPAKFS